MSPNTDANAKIITKYHLTPERKREAEAIYKKLTTIKDSPLEQLGVDDNQNYMIFGDVQHAAIDTLQQCPNLVQQAFPDNILVDRAQYERMQAFIDHAINLMPVYNTPESSYNYLIRIHKAAYKYMQGETP
jgi:hypothetical protein